MFDYGAQQKRRVARKLLELIETGRGPDTWPELRAILLEPGMDEKRLLTILGEINQAIQAARTDVQFR